MRRGLRWPKDTSIEHSARGLRWGRIDREPRPRVASSRAQRSERACAEPPSGPDPAVVARADRASAARSNNLRASGRSVGAGRAITLALGGGRDRGPPAAGCVQRACGWRSSEGRFVGRAFFPSAPSFKKFTHAENLKLVRRSGGAGLSKPRCETPGDRRARGCGTTLKRKTPASAASFRCAGAKNKRRAIIAAGRCHGVVSAAA